jgi:hypothetical protein
MITKIYYGEFVYLYHQDLTLKRLNAFIRMYITEKETYLLQWKEGDEMVGIVRDEDLDESVHHAITIKLQEAKRHKAVYNRVYLSLLESDEKKALLSSIINYRFSLDSSRHRRS